MSKSSRSEAVILKELEQTMENVVKHEEELKKARETLKSLNKQLTSKEKELTLQNQEVKEQFDLLENERQIIKKQKSDLNAQEEQAIANTFSAMIEEVETKLADVNSVIEEQTKEYDKANETVKGLQRKEVLFIDIAEADHKRSLIELVKDNLNDLSQIASENSQDQRLINDIVNKIKREKEIGHKEAILDDLIFEEEQRLTQKLKSAGETRESLNDFAQNLIQESDKAGMEPKDFLNSLILHGDAKKKEKVEKIILLEQEEGSLKVRLEELKELKSTVYEIDQIPQEIVEELAKKRDLLLQREKEIHNKLVEADNSELAAIDKLVNEINSVKKSLEIQKNKVKDAQKLLYQEGEMLEELKKEHKELLKKPKVKNKQEEEIPEQFYLSTSPQFFRLSETIKHRKELRQLKEQHANKHALLEGQILQLQKENGLQQQSNNIITKELENAKNINQDLQKRIEELEKQIVLSPNLGPSLADEFRELENQSDTENLSELQALIKKQNIEIDTLKERLKDKDKEQQIKQEELDKIKGSEEGLNQENSKLKQELSAAKQTIEKEDLDIQELESKVTQLMEKLETSERVERKANEEHENVHAAEKTTKIDPKKVHTQEPADIKRTTTNKISDNVSTVSIDQILRDFRELREIQRDVVVGSKTIEDAPVGNEAFHKYAAQHGTVIGNALNPEISELMGAIEHEKYQEIHQKYPHKDIEWKGGNQASITKDGIEICKLNNKSAIANDSEKYKLEGITINHYRNLDLPVKAKGGPMHMSLAVKDLQGKNINNKDAVYLTAHYDKEGQLVEMTTPIPVYFTSASKDSPVCIKRKGKIYTLPVNRGKYEEMCKEIEINKGIAIGVVKDTKVQDSIILEPKTNKIKSLIPEKVVTSLKPYTAEQDTHVIMSRKNSKGLNGHTK